MSRSALFALGLAVFGSLSPVSARAADVGKTATSVAVAGAIAGVAAMPALGAGSLMIKAGSEHTPGPTYAAGMGLYAGGYVAATTGTATLALGALSARRSLVRAGAGPVSAVPGALSLGAFGVTAAFAYVVPVVADVRGSGWIGAVSYGSALGLGVAQLVLNGRARRRLHGVARVRPQVAPSIAPDKVGVWMRMPF